METCATCKHFKAIDVLRDGVCGVLSPPNRFIVSFNRTFVVAKCFGCNQWEKEEGNA